MPQPFLLTAFEFNNSNARARRKGRLYFLSAAISPARSLTFQRIRRAISSQRAVIFPILR